MSNDENKPIKVNYDNTQLLISGDEIPFGAYQAIYHKLTRKSEKRNKSYPNSYQINKSDLQNLNQRIIQTIAQYNVVSNRCQVTHTIQDDTSIEHTSFEKFWLSDCSSRSTTSGLNYEFDFLIILPAEVPEAKEIAQRFKLNLTIYQVKFDEDDNNVHFLIRGRNLGGDLQLTMEYSDYAVSQNLIAAVDSWVDNLPTQTKNKAVRKIFKYERTTRNVIPPVVKFLTILMAALFISKLNDVIVILPIFLFALGLASLLNSFVYMTIDRFYEKLPLINPHTCINLTQGDSDNIDTIKTNKKKVYGILSFLFFGIIVTITLSLTSSALYEYIF